MWARRGFICPADSFGRRTRQCWRRIGPGGSGSPRPVTMGAIWRGPGPCMWTWRSCRRFFPPAAIPVAVCLACTVLPGWPGPARFRWRHWGESGLSAHVGSRPFRAWWPWPGSTGFHWRDRVTDGNGVQAGRVRPVRGFRIPADRPGKSSARLHRLRYWSTPGRHNHNSAGCRSAPPGLSGDIRRPVPPR